MNGIFNINDTVMSNWRILRLLGEGGFGRVYEIGREEFGVSYRAALKIITIPRDKSEITSVLGSDADRDSITTYYGSVVRDLVQEFALMSQMKGNSHVVSYEDHQVIPHSDGLGWDILIRMELLTPLNTYAAAHGLARKDIIKLGIDICQALELCQKFNILHRDIKPENIFVSLDNDFKLGDFGIARVAEKTSAGLSRKGTLSYMAPEVNKGQAYGSGVDIYSLGVVLYRLLNNNRLPLVPPYPQPITYNDVETALQRRNNGETLPPPANATGRLAEIVCRACAYLPAERYSGPTQLRQELAAILYTESEGRIIYPAGDRLPIEANRYADAVSATIGRVPDDAGTGGSIYQPVSDLSPVAEQATQGLFAPGTLGAGGYYEATRGQETLGGGFTYGAASASNERIFAPSPPAPPPAKAKKSKTPLIICALLVVVIAAGLLLWQSIVGGQQRDAEQYQQLLDQAATCYEANPEQAKGLLLSAQQLLQQEGAAYVSYAYALYMNGEYQACSDYVENLLLGAVALSEDETGEAYAIWGAAAFELADYVSAANYFFTGSTSRELTGSYLLDYAVSLGRSGNIVRAQEILEQLIAAGQDDLTTQYIEAEIAFAQADYAGAEQGFDTVLSATEGALQKRALTSLAELYRDCARLEYAGGSSVSNPQGKGAQLLQTWMPQLQQESNAVLWEMLGAFCYDCYILDDNSSLLPIAANAFENVLRLGITKQYIYSNLFAIYLPAQEYERAYSILAEMENLYPRSFLPPTLRGILIVAQENAKAEDSRDYAAVLSEYEKACTLITGEDDSTQLQQLESYIHQLRDGGWL